MEPKLGDSIVVRPMGTMTYKRGAFISLDRSAGTITILTQRGEQTTIVYGTFSVENTDSLQW